MLGSYINNSDKLCYMLQVFIFFFIFINGKYTVYAENSKAKIKGEVDITLYDEIKNNFDLRLVLSDRYENISYGADLKIAQISNNELNKVKPDSFLYMQSQYGKIEFGGNSSVFYNMSVDAANLTKNLTYSHYYLDKDNNYPRYHNFGSNYINNQKHEPVKVSYYTPEVNGLELGFSYIPRSSNKNKDNLSMAASYKTSTSKFDIITSLAGEYEAHEQENQLISYKIGALISRGTYSFAASYSDNKYSKNTQEPRSRLYSLGAAYNQGPISTSLTYFKIEHEKNKMQIMNIGANYKISPGILPYVEIAYFDRKEPNSKEKNKNGTIWVFGTKIKW